MTVLKDKCRKWYFVPELILLPLAHWKILEFYKRAKSPWAEPKMILRAWSGCYYVNGRVWRRKLPRVRLAPGKCLSLHSARLEAISDPGADQGAAQSSDRTSQWLRTRLWAFSNPRLLLLFKPPCFRKCLKHIKDMSGFSKLESLPYDPDNGWDSVPWQSDGCLALSRSRVAAGHTVSPIQRRIPQCLPNFSAPKCTRKSPLLEPSWGRPLWSRLYSQLGCSVLNRGYW